MKIIGQIKKADYMNIYLFIVGAVFSYFVPQAFEAVFNKIAQYFAGMALIFSAFFYFNKSSQKIKFLWGGVVFSIAFQFLNSFSYYFDSIANDKLLSIVLVLIAIFIFFYFSRNRLIIKYFLAGLMLSIAVQSILATYISFNNRINNPFRWDFLCFFINGKVASQGLNYYSPENYIKVYDQLEIPILVDYEFYRETVEVGLQYFPQSIFLFLPLGLFDFMNAHLLWNYLLLLFLILDLLLIKKIFFKDQNLFYYLFILPIFLFFSAVRHSINFDSYSFIMLFALLMIWKEKNANLIGFWLAVGIFLKPMGLIFLLYPLLRKKWKALFYSIFYTIVSLIITVIFIGSDTVFSFFAQNTVKNLPSWSYVDQVNQSLLPTILRLTNYDFYFGSPLFHPYFIISGLVISIISFWIIYRLDKSKDELSLSLVTIYTLIIYPSTLNHYFLLAIPVIFFIIKTNLENKFYLTLVTLGLAYCFMIYVPFITILVLMIFLTYYALIQIKANNKIENLAMST